MTIGSEDVLCDVAIDRHGEIPIGVQLAWALRARIGDGRLSPGERLPGLRELAEALGINANTARAVYQRLEQEGLIESRQGTGTFVAQSTDGRSAQAGQIAAEAAERAQSTGVDPREVAAALYVAVPGAETDAVPAAAQAQNDTAERRRALRGQIAALEQALSELQMHDPSLIPAPTEPARRAGPRLLSVAELEEVRTDLLHRLTEPLTQSAPAQKDDRVKAQTAKTKRAAKTKPAKPARSASGQPALHSPVPTIRPAPAST